MPRFIFGGEVTHVGVQEDAANADAFKRGPAGVTLEWRTVPGGVVVADFLLWDGAAFTIAASAITSDAAGYPPPFQGPDGVKVLYDSAGYALVARDLYGADIADLAATVAAGDAAGLAAAVAYADSLSVSTLTEDPDAPGLYLIGV